MKIWLEKSYVVKTINEKFEDKAHWKANVVRSICGKTKFSSGNVDNIAGVVVNICNSLL